jgi:hypothetical protein
LLQLNNFNTAMAILHGINQWAVSASSIYQVYSVQSLKLTTVWPELSKRDKKVRGLNRVRGAQRGSHRFNVNESFVCGGAFWPGFRVY